MSLSLKLNRMKKHIVTQATPDAPPATDAPDLPYAEQWAAFQTYVCAYEEQFCLVREVSYALADKWGQYRFGDLQAVVEKWNACPHHHPLSAKGIGSTELIFFDTETTGLSSGAGNTIFLLGVGRVRDDRVVVRQYFLPHPGAEVALYHHFLSDVHDMKNLVTYNGKAFDWPQVKTRHTFVRDRVPNLPSFGHYDLLHGARRLWKHDLPSLRLSIVEQERLGIVRKNDTPGQLAPLLYFDFLKSRNPADVMPVFRHNEWDILSLISLYIHMSHLLLEEAGQLMSAREHYEVGRWYAAVGEHERALHSYQFAARDNSTQAYSAKKAAAAIYKKRREWEQAVSLWKACCNGKWLDPEPYTELAKAYEHHYKDYDEALFYAEKAYDVWRQAKRIVKKADARERGSFQKRIRRLEARCSQTFFKWI